MLTTTIKQMCDLYHDGHSITYIANITNNTRESVHRMLKTHYFDFIGEKFLSKQDKKKAKLAEIKDKFNKIYVPFKYSRAEICRALGCTIVEFESMLQLYNINYLRLNTYKAQKTLCNIPYEIYNEYKEFIRKKGISMRQLACRAINTYLLMEEDD